MWGALFNTIGQSINGHFERREARKVREDQLEQAQLNSRIRILEEDNEHAMNMDLYMVKQSGMKRNVSFYAACTPLVMAFIPATHDTVAAGFEAIEGMPEWYRYGLAAMMVSVWGYRRLLRTFMNNRLNGIIRKKNGSAKNP